MLPWKPKDPIIARAIRKLLRAVKDRCDHSLWYPKLIPIEESSQETTHRSFVALGTNFQGRTHSAPASPAKCIPTKKIEFVHQIGAGCGLDITSSGKVAGGGTDSGERTTSVRRFIVGAERSQTQGCQETAFDTTPPSINLQKKRPVWA